jgi:hypothetical protein
VSFEQLYDKARNGLKARFHPEPNTKLRELKMPESEDSQKNDEKLSYRIITNLESACNSITSDGDYLYAACQDKKIRIWSKKDWKLVSELGETSTTPLSVHVDEMQVFATCERRVYVWKKKTWGMIGWFELSSEALASTLQADRFYVGSKDGRLVSIHKETHETLSWPLHRSDITQIWSDGNVICTGTKKEAPIVWRQKKGGAPTEESRLGTERSAEFTGNRDFILVGSTSGNVSVWDRRDWSYLNSLESRSGAQISAMWANENYLLTGSEQGLVEIWDLKSGSNIGLIEPIKGRIITILADDDLVYLVNHQSIVISQLLFNSKTLNLDIPSKLSSGESLLRTSPYDVLESALKTKRKGDDHFQASSYQEAVKDYEKSLQILIDNTHALSEVPEEREELTHEINNRLSRALMKAHIDQLNAISKENTLLSDELDLRGESSLEDDEIERFWVRAQRIIKEARALADGESDNILGYQLQFTADSVDADIKQVKEKIQRFREKVNQALALTHRISQEWRWMEKEKTRLEERKEYLERVIEEIDKNLQGVESSSEVSKILHDEKDRYIKLHSQITRIIEASDDELVEEMMNKEEARSAIETLLKSMPMKRDLILSISDKEEQNKKYTELVKVLESALKNAEKYKLKEESRHLQNELTSLKSHLN